jgi:DNA-directed RNA polymerase subunit RPC12/RpoP
MDNPLTCSKCGQEMREGYVAEMSQQHTGRIRWIADPPVMGFLGLNTRGKEIIEIRTFRCPGCGFLEFYAWK